MKVKDLIQFIIDNDISDDTEVYVSCCGYCNYNFKENEPYEEETRMVIRDNKLFIGDSCHVEVLD